MPERFEKFKGILSESEEISHLEHEIEESYRILADVNREIHSKTTLLAAAYHERSEANVQAARRLEAELDVLVKKQGRLGDFITTASERINAIGENKRLQN